MATPKTVTTEDLADQVEQLKKDIASLTQTIGELGKSKGSEMARSVREQAEAARAAGETHLADLQARAVGSVHDAEDYVRRNPATALGIAAGFGLLVGLMSARR